MKEKKKVLHIVEAMGGGVFTYLVELANGMSDEFDITIAFGMRKETPQNYFNYFEESIKIIKVNNFTRELNLVKDVKSYFELKDIIREVNPDIIHMHSSKAGALGRLVFGLKKVKMFYTPHGYSFLMDNESTLKRKIYETIEKILGKRKCLTVACGKSEWEQSTAVTRHSTYISNGINIEKIKNNLMQADVTSETADIKKPGFTVYTVGRIDYQKWPELFNQIAERLPHINFVWIGDGDLREKLTATNITVIGWMENQIAMKLAGEFDAFILASRYEGLPISLLEAMYMKKVCIVSNVPGNRDVIKNDYNGYICDDVEQFVSAISEVERGVDLKLIDRAYKDILEQYNSECLCNGYRKLYKESGNEWVK